MTVMQLQARSGVRKTTAVVVEKSFQERSAARTEAQIKVRVQQIQDECQRQVSVHKEEVQKLWDKKMKEMEERFKKEALHESKEAHEKSSKELIDENEKLKTEMKELQEELNDVTKHFNDYKSQMDQIANLVKDHGAGNQNAEVIEPEKKKEVANAVASPNVKT